MQLKLIGAVVVGIIFLWGSQCLANGGAPVTKEPVISEEKVSEPAMIEPSVSEVSPEAGPLKKPEVATILSVICPGLGQFYNDDGGKALLMLGIEGLCWVMIGSDMDELGIFGISMGRIISSVEAYHRALEKNKGLSLKIDNEKILVAIKRNF